MIIDRCTPNVNEYKVFGPNGHEIVGLASFDTDTLECIRMVLKDERVLTETMPDGSKKYTMLASGIEYVKEVLQDGTYATFRGQRVE